MEKYDYRRAVIDDIKDWIVNNSDIMKEDIKEDRDDELSSWIYDEIWTVDSVTGNGYNWYDNEEKCSEYLSNNFDLLYTAAREYCIDDDINMIIEHYKNKSLARYFDCTIRCYLLGECIEKALEELQDEMG